jgi:hypothetical protein
VYCHGGYEIGARTIAKPGGSTFDGVTLPPAPSSCLAAVLLPLVFNLKTEM